MTKKRKLLLTELAIVEVLSDFIHAGLVAEFHAEATTSESWADDDGGSVSLENVGRRQIARIPVTLPDGEMVVLSPGGQNPLIKQVIEQFCARFAPGGVVVYIGDAENKFEHLHAAYLTKLGVVIDSADKMPDVVVHDTKRNWLLLIEAVTSVGPIDGKRRKELKELFKQSSAGLVFVTAFENRKTMQSFLPLLSWETEVWVAEAPDHLIHFNGERFLGPYPDAMPKTR